MTEDLEGNRRTMIQANFSSRLWAGIGFLKNYQ